MVGGYSGLQFQKGVTWRIWTKIYCSARNLLVHHSSLSHTTYVETNNKLWCILQHLSQTKIPLFQTHLQTELGKKFTLGAPLRNHSGKREVTYANVTYDNVTLLRCTWSTPCETTAHLRYGSLRSHLLSAGAVRFNSHKM